MWGEGWGTEAPSLPKPEGPGDHSVRGVPRRRGRRPLLPAWGRVLPAFWNQRETEVPRPPCPRGAPGPAGGYTFLGFRPTW